MTGLHAFPVTAVGADERHLYVSDYPRRHVRRYDLAALEAAGRTSQ